MGKKITNWSKEFKKRMTKAPVGYQFARNILEKQNFMLSQISKQEHSLYVEEAENLASAIMLAELDDLKKLRDFYKKKEEEFFNSLQNIKNWKELYEVIKDWNKEKSFILKDEKIIEEIATIMEEATFAELTDVIKGMPENTMAEIIQDVFAEDLQMAGNLVLEGLSGRGKKGGIEGGRSGTLFATFTIKSGNLKEGYTYTALKQQNGKIKGTKGLTLFRRKDSRKKDKDAATEVEIHFTQDISPSARRKISDKIIEEVRKKDEAFTFSGDTRKDVMTKIKNVVAAELELGTDEIDSDPIIQIIQEYIINNNQININRSRSVIRGALGEIYWGAFFKTLMGKDYRPTGFDLKVLGKNTEIPVDVALKGCGAQVKNYTPTMEGSDEVVSFNTHFDRELGEKISNEVSLSAFLGLTGYAHLQVGHLEKTFGEYWFSRAYNKPNPDKFGAGKEPDGQVRPEQENYANYRDNIYPRYDYIDEGINTYFKTLMDQLLSFYKDLRIDPESYEFLDDHFLPGAPTFYIINDKFFPTSFLIEQLYNQLNVDEPERLIQFIVRDYSIDLRSFDIDKNKQYPAKINPQGIIKNGFENGRITYRVDVDISSLQRQLEKALENGLL